MRTNVIRNLFIGWFILAGLLTFLHGHDGSKPVRPGTVFLILGAAMMWGVVLFGNAGTR